MSKKAAITSPHKTVARDSEFRTGGKGLNLTALAVVAIALVTIYWTALKGGPLWDDDAHITKLELRSAYGLWRIWFEVGATQQYYPLTHSVFWLEHLLWGEHTLGYHIVNLFLHGVSALIFFRILQRLRIPGAWLAACLFALHPVMVESVAWITELKNTLSAVCYLAAAITYIKFDEERSRSVYIQALGLFGLALLSKTVTATLPAALLVLFWFQRGKISLKRDGVPLLPWFALGAIAGLFTAWVERKFIGAEGDAFSLSIAERFLLAGRAFWFYLGKILWPHDLMFVYPRWRLDPSNGWHYLYPIAAAALTVAAWSVRKINRAPVAVLLLFAGTLFPVLGFFNIYPFLFSYVADHFQYLASLPVIAAVAAAWTSIQKQSLSEQKWLGPSVTLLALGLLSVQAWRQSQQYLDAPTLYRSTIARNSLCWMAYSNLGDILVHDGHPKEAIAFYQNALEINPLYANIHNNLGYALMKAARIPEAIQQFEIGLKLKPLFAEMHYNFGDTLLQAGRPEDAIDHYTTALRLKPAFTEVHCNLAYALFCTGRLNESIEHYQIALHQYDGSAELHFNLGIAYLRADKYVPARQQFEDALHINPDFTAARQNLELLDQKSPRTKFP